MVKVTENSYLNSIESYKPGKNKIEGNSGKIIKLSSNENALGCSSEAKKAYQNHVEDVFRYADGSCTNLRVAIGDKYKINSDNIVCGAGSDEILAMLASAYSGVNDEIIYSKHGFLMYEISAKRVGSIPVSVEERNLKADIDAIIKAVTDKTKIIFLANPNNPTGSYLTNDDVEKLIKGVPKNVLIVFDHAYDEFVNGVEDYPDAIKLVKENENVVMTRTFSKIYGLASLRIGWCYANSDIIDILNRVRGPFNVGGPAQFAAEKAIGDEKFLQKSLDHNNKWLEKFFNEAKNYQNVRAYPSIANFILFDFASSENAKKANEKFAQNGVIVRQMDSYFLPSCLRITIGNDEENELVLGILREIDD